jgi:hypothetical protein
MLWRLRSSHLGLGPAFLVWKRTPRVTNRPTLPGTLMCMSRRLSIGGGCFKNRRPHLNIGRVVFADTVLSCRSWMSRSSAIVNVPTVQNCIPPTTWSVHSHSSNMLREVRACYNRGHHLVCDGIQTKMATLLMLFTSPYVVEFLECNDTCG